MRIGVICAVSSMLLVFACAQPPQPQSGTPEPTTASAIPGLSQQQIVAEVEHLRAVLLDEVPQPAARTDATDRAWMALAKAEVGAASFSIDHPQLLVVVDRNPHVQELRILLAQPADRPWLVIGGGKVSTGQTGRHGYFITPTGVFRHTAGILDYRALGTYNENGIRGLGIQGMRVWDFGWETAEKGWATGDQQGEIRLLMHATDPDYLEQRLGRPASQGCVRVAAAMNRFLDRHGVLDADYERAARDDARFDELLLPGREPTPLAGDALVIVDSASA